MASERQKKVPQFKKLGNERGTKWGTHMGNTYEEQYENGVRTPKKNVPQFKKWGTSGGEKWGTGLSTKN